MFGVGKVWWLSPLPGSSGRSLSIMHVDGITQLGSKCNRQLCSLLTVGTRVVAASAQQVIRCLLCTNIVILPNVGRDVSCVLTLFSLMCKLCNPIRKLLCLRNRSELLGRQCVRLLAWHS